MKKILAIDYGKKRIGTALSDINQKIALPFKTITTENTLNKTIDKIINNLKEELFQIEKILIGYPLLLSGQKGQMALDVELFKNELEKKLDIPIELVDERLTSSQADKSLKDLHMKRKKRSKHIDEYAAMIILQTYLDQTEFS